MQASAWPLTFWLCAVHAAVDRHVVHARVAVVQEDGRCTFDVSEITGDALSIGGVAMFGERFALVVVPDDPAPSSSRFNVDG